MIDSNDSGEAVGDGSAHHSPSRQLVVCCDGTNNTLTAGAQDTNVLRLFELLPDDDPLVLRYYDPGVGAAEDLPATSLWDPITARLERAYSLAIGRGIYDNIAQAYLFLCRHHRAGDEIFLFGFSRGAFTVRCVAGMINMFGLIRPVHEPLLPTLLRIYFSGNENAQRTLHRWVGERAQGRPHRRGNKSLLAQQVRTHFCGPAGREAAVHFVGVWDTVETVGLRGFRRTISNSATMRGKCFRHVRHALSLDEHRLAFRARYYLDRRALPPGQTLKQVWFRGTHSDVGGGGFAGQAGLSLDALDWIVDEARAVGLRCSDPVPAPGHAFERQLNDELHSSPWWAVAGMTLRDPSAAPGGNVDGLRLDAPAQHPRVGEEVARSVWAQRRTWRGLAVALIWSALWATLSGTEMLLPDERVRVFEPATWGQAGASLAAGAHLAALQLHALWAPAQAWSDVAGMSADGASPRAALLLDGLFALGYAYLLARVSSRAFAWLAGWRQVGQPMPWWQRLRLGQALSLLLIADTVENVMGIAAWSLGPGWQSSALLWCGGVAAVAKWVGLAGVVLLALAGWRGRRVPAHRVTP